MHLALAGTRGVPPRYGGFETAVAEIGSRLAGAGHRVTVYCRRTSPGPHPAHWRGMRLVTLPAVRERHLETLSHSAASIVHDLVKERAEVVVMFNAANSVFVPALRAAGVPCALNTDGLEWKRQKWGWAGRRYYRAAERLAARTADALIADSVEIQRHYVASYGVEPVFIPYGAPVLDQAGTDLLPPGLEPRRYHLVVARLEPENHVVAILEAHRRSGAALPLVVVGSNPYPNGVTAALAAAAGNGADVRALGSVWDQSALDQLYAHALLYIHGHSAGGTNPSLLRAMGAGAPVAAFDTPFNREVLAGTGDLWSTPEQLATLLRSAEGWPAPAVEERAERSRHRVGEAYDWDEVARRYGDLAESLLDRRRR